MAGITVCRHQRAGARATLNEAMAVANGWESWKRTCYREWLTQPSEGLRMLLGQAGEDAKHWHSHRAPLLKARWRGDSAAA